MKRPRPFFLLPAGAALVAAGICIPAAARPVPPALAGAAVRHSSASVDSTAAASLPRYRNPATWPFAATSPWNTPIGSHARYSSASGCTSDVRNTSYGTDMNTTQWSVPVYQASNSSPRATFVNQNTGQSFAATMPAGVTGEGPAGGDNDLAVINTSREVTDEFWQARVQGQRVTASDYARYSLYGPGIGRPRQGDQQGVRAYGGSLIAGLIRMGELKNGIHHALAFSEPRSLNRNGPVWPAIGQDGGGGYTGHVPMGQLVFIPRWNFSGLGLSPYGILIARALHRYGAYLVDSSGDWSLYAERDIQNQIGQSGHDTIAYSDLPILHKLLICVTNNSPHSVGGGGTYPSELKPPPFSPPPPAVGQPARQG
jgi:hypothetical protein